MALTEYVMMPGEDYQAACDMLRSKTGKTDLIKSGDLATEIGDLCDGGSDRNPDSKPIRFYDPYGNVLYGYTRAEAQELTELPPGPALDGVTFDRWTHTLEEIKNTQYFADVGPQYKHGSEPAVVLIFDVIDASKSLNLCLNITNKNYKATVYWGDGATTTVAGSSAGNLTPSHTYSTAGRKVVAIVAETDSIFKLGFYYSNYYYGIMNSYISSSATVESIPNRFDAKLLSVLIGAITLYNVSFVDLDTVVWHIGLRFVSLNNLMKSAPRPRGFMNCSALKAIAGSKPLNRADGYLFGGCASLSRVWIDGDIAANALPMCRSLNEVIYGSGKISTPNMNVDWAMLMTTETPPTIGATSPVWGNKPIYVPDSAVDTYKTADGWSAAANYILPRSQYPD